MRAGEWDGGADRWTNDGVVECVLTDCSIGRAM